MLKYRFTRPDAYPFTCAGYSDLTARQGYYITAISMEVAQAQMVERFPNDSSFDCEVC